MVYGTYAEVDYTSPYFHSSVDSNTFTMGNPMRESTLKVPKREIFHRSDFPDFYTIKSLCVGDFSVKIKKILNNN